MLTDQKSAISAALPPELSRAPGASGLRARSWRPWRGGSGRDSRRSVDGFERRDRSKFDSEFRRQLSRAER